MGKISRQLFRKVSSKKGIFFTFIAITMMAIFILVYTPQADISIQKDKQAVRSRIYSVDSYINDLENEYLDVVLRATTQKAMVSLISYINTTGNYLIDLDGAFYSVMMNGTIQHPQGSSNYVLIDSVTGRQIMHNNTLLNWSSRISSAAKDTLNVETYIVIRNVTISQKKPWDIESGILVNITVISDVAVWRIENLTLVASTSIEGLQDPYYIVNTQGRYATRIKKSSMIFNQWNISHVREHVRNGTYIHWTDSHAPSFLMKFTNATTNSSCCGIESIVDPNKIAPSDLADSYLDYMLWNPSKNTPCQDIYNLTKPGTNGGIWDEFRFLKLDLNSTIRFNITSEHAIRAFQQCP